MKRQALLLLAIALTWLVAASAALAEDGEGDQPTEPAKKGRRLGRQGNAGKAQNPNPPAAKGAVKAPNKGPAKPPVARPQKPVKGGPAKGEPKEGEEESEEGSVFVLPDKDAVILRDGTRVDGTILCAGQAAVTILTADGEKTIQREQIERVIQNADAGVPEKFKAEELDGHKYLKKEEVAEGDEAEAPPPKKAVHPGPPPAKPPAVLKAPPAAAPAQPPVAAKPAAPPPVPQPPAAAPSLMLPKDPAQLRAFIDQLRREGKLDALLKDPRALEALRNALKQNAAK